MLNAVDRLKFCYVPQRVTIRSKLEYDSDMAEIM